MQMAKSTLFLLCLIFLNFEHSVSLSLSVENLKEDVIVSSPKGTFTAGFYPVGDNAYCFAIWYTQQPQTLVWMANRDQPVNGKRSKLSLLDIGNLVLTDADQFQVWSTNTVTSSDKVQLSLYDTGNLVLLDNSNHSSPLVLWQSFDFPTDTLLPNQPLSENTNLISSRSGTNYSSGFYKLFFDSENVLRLMYQGPRVSSVYWPYAWLQNNNFGNGNGRSTYNDSRVVVLDDFGKLVSSDNFTFTTTDYGIMLQRRLTLDHDGNVRLYSIQDGQHKWSVSGIFRLQPCFIHGICGPNSYCSHIPTTGRNCSCLPGYRWIDSEDWSQGCEPNFQLWCNNNNKTEQEFSFLRLPEVDFYGYDYGLLQNQTYQQCADRCLELCQCKGFQHSFSGGNGDSGQCYLKTQLLNGHHSPGFSGAFMLRVPLSQDYDESERAIGLVCGGSSNGKENFLERPYVEEKENGSLKFMLWFAIGLGVIQLVCIFLVWCFLLRENRTLDPIDDKHGYVLAAATGFRKFSYSELKQASKGFSEEIGRGGGGTVYKGVLSDDRVVAIKRLHEVANQGESEFLAEVSIIGRLNHMNLIGMLGYCAEGKYRLLVYEYMENGSLAENLSSTSNVLDWSKRYNIALGTARGLAYLHEECLEWVLHCDIKPQNILLDSDYKPKVADFGLSKLLNRSSNVDNSSFSRIRGTRGYMAPEWVFNLAITSKVDVYSYGIVVLEMITGRSPTTGVQITEIEAKSPHHERLVTWVREKRKKGSEMGSFWVDQIVDPALGLNYDMNKMEILATVALECVEEEKDVRPTMSQVAERLLRYEHDS